MQYEFDRVDAFDPAQLNLIILQSHLSYQYLKEMQARKTAKPETAYNYVVDQSIKQ